MRTSLILLFSSLWVTHLAGMGLDLVLTVSLLLSHCSFFVFGGGISIFFFFLDGPPVDGCSTASCNFGALAGDERTSFYSTILLQFSFEKSYFNKTGKENK